MTPTQARVLERTATSPSAGELRAVHDPGHPPRQGLGQLPGRDLAAATLAVIRQEWVATLFGLSAIFAVITALVSINAPERLWGELAAVCYTISAVIAVAARRRGPTLAALVSLAGALLAPLIWMAATGLAQPEVHVIIRSAQMLVQTGTPYSSPAALAAAHNWLAYDPYLPVLGLVCLGLALADRAVPGQWRWPVAAGLALGLAAAMKATAWPALAVALIPLVRRGGWRAAGGFTMAVAGLIVVTDGPVVAAHPAAAVANTILYPLGPAKVASPAASQLPGHLLASAGTWGHWAALALMAAAGVAVTASLIIRPPASAQAAGWWLVLGLTLLFGLAPASRVGYFVYPAGLAAWLLLVRLAKTGPPEDRTGLPGERSVDPVPASGRTVAGFHD